MTDTI